LPTDLIAIAHILPGTLALLLYWAAALSQKGSTRHKFLGRMFMASLCLVVLSIIPVLVSHSHFFDQLHKLQFAYRAVNLGSIAWIAWTAIRWRGDLTRFRGWQFQAFGWFNVIAGCMMLVVGAYLGRAMPVVFSLLGAGYGALMLYFARAKTIAHPRWWQAWHVLSVCLISSVVHGTVLAVIWRSYVNPNLGERLNFATQGGTIVLSLILFVWIAKKRHLPLLMGVGNRRPSQNAGTAQR
jgi:hypothetical protein